MTKKEKLEKAKKTAKIIGIFSGLILVVILGLVFLFVSPIGKKSTLKVPSFSQILKIEKPSKTFARTPEAIPLEKVLLSPQEIIVTTTTIADAVIAVFQKIFGLITSGLGAFFLIKKVKEEKKTKKG